MKCSVDDCMNEAERRGWCNKHYLRWWKHGDPSIASKVPNVHHRRSLRDHPAPTPQPTPCRLWQGHLKAGCPVRGNGQRVHRWVMEQVLGHTLSPAEVVMHKCDQPLCYRYEHLQLGTVAENNADMRAKGRGRYAVQLGEEHHRAVLTEALVREIRSSPESTRKIATRLGINHATVRDARKGRMWTHVQ